MPVVVGGLAIELLARCLQIRGVEVQRGGGRG